jgi:hypothetical protein
MLLGRNREERSLHRIGISADDGRAGPMCW